MKILPLHLQLSSICKFIALATMVALPDLQADQPNVLIIMADDCTHNDLPTYGGENAITPNLDALANQSLVFNRAYLCSAMCQPCRAELYTGLYPMRNGCAWNHSASRRDVRSLPHHLKAAGYRVGIAGKVHVTPKSVFPFENVDGFDKSCVRNPTKQHDLAAVSEFMTRDRREPYCLVVALVEPHVPWVMGDPRQYPPAKIKLPPNIADTERTRKDFANYLAEITYMDGQVGELLKALEVSGTSSDTLVLFTSEQGSQFPGCKWTNWDTGVHTALFARWPGKIRPGTTDALVQYADVVPTILELAGGTIESQELDGTSFASVLRGESTSHRQYVFGMHNNVPEGPPYPIRSVTDGRYHYIRNLSPQETYIEKHLMGIRGEGALNNPYWGTWVWDAAANDRTYQLVRRYTNRPPEQLYDLTSDPYEMKNLAEKPEYQQIRKTLSSRLDAWMHEQSDPGIEQDKRATHASAKAGKHLFGPGISETQPE